MTTVKSLVKLCGVRSRTGAAHF